jgi:hypothetical protein
MVTINENYLFNLTTTAGEVNSSILGGPTSCPTWFDATKTQDLMQEFLKSIGHQDSYRYFPIIMPKDSSMQILNDIKNVTLEHAAMDDLLMLHCFATMLTDAYATWHVDPPEWLLKRQAAFAKAIPAALLAEADKLQEEADALRSKEEKRQDLEARAKKLRDTLKKQDK